jgi:hypothetical protein
MGVVSHRSWRSVVVVVAIAGVIVNIAGAVIAQREVDPVGGFSSSAVGWLVFFALLLASPFALVGLAGFSSKRVAAPAVLSLIGLAGIAFSVKMYVDYAASVNQDGIIVVALPFVELTCFMLPALWAFIPPSSQGETVEMAPPTTDHTVRPS